MVSTILPLKIRGIELFRGGRRILGPISWELAGAGLTMVMGPNGSGKTTFLRAMHGLERLNKGALHWAGGEAEVRAAQSFVFQTPILMRRSVRDCIAYPLMLNGMGKAAARAAAQDAGARVGLGPLGDVPAQVLSGGERQKLALVRALITKPQLLFLDEPCANLDGRSTREIETILNNARAAGTRIVMSTHDIGQARRMADDVLFLCGGRIIETAPAAVFFETPQTTEAASYLNGDLIL